MRSRPRSTPCLGDGKAIASSIRATRFHRGGAPNSSADAIVEAPYLRYPEGDCSYLQRGSAGLPQAVFNPWNLGRFGGRPVERTR